MSAAREALDLIKHCLECLAIQSGSGPSDIPGVQVQALRDIREAVEKADKWDAVQEQDICGLCGEPGADKMPHPEHWPGEQMPDTELVHAECESEECGRAHAALSDEQRRAHLGMS